MPPAAPLLARRATDIIVMACRSAGGTVLLPGLYCAEVAEGIEAAGCAVGCYDISSDLSAPAPQLTGDVRVVVWHHPFGRYLPPPIVPGALLIEDACFSLRTVLAMAGRPAPELMVFSLRKELGWPDGGLAIGRHAGALRAQAGPPGEPLAARWHSTDLDAEIRYGRKATAYATAELGDRLPPAVPGQDILTVLPLLSTARDEVTAALRASGVGAWYWQRSLPGCTPAATPRAWDLWRRLLLVPVPEAGSPVYRLLAEQAFESWAPCRR